MSPRPDAPSLPVVGARARLRRSVERFPHFVADIGAAGTITTASEELIAMKLDRVLPGAEEWDNEVCWTPDLGEAIVGSDATAEGQIAAAFHADAEIVGPLRFCDHHRQRYAGKDPDPRGRRVPDRRLRRRRHGRWRR